MAGRKDIRMSLGAFFGFNVAVSTAVEADKESSFNMICEGVADSADHPPHNPCGIKQAYRCPVCSNEDRTQMSRGKIQGDGTVIKVDAEDLDEINADNDTKRTMEITASPVDQVVGQTLVSGKSYYLEPGTGSNAPYSLLAKVIENRPDLAFLTVWTYTKKPAMYRVTSVDGTLVLSPYAWPEQVREAPDFDRPEPSEKDLGQASALVDMIQDDFDVDSFRDTRREKIAAIIAQATSLEGAEVPDVRAKAKPIHDMSGALEQALAAAKAAKGTAPGATQSAGKVPAKPKATKKAAAKAAPAKGDDE